MHFASSFSYIIPLWSEDRSKCHQNQYDICSATKLIQRPPIFHSNFNTFLFYTLCWRLSSSSSMPIRHYCVRRSTLVMSARLSVKFPFPNFPPDVLRDLLYLSCPFDIVFLLFLFSMHVFVEMRFRVSLLKPFCYIFPSSRLRSGLIPFDPAAPLALIGTENDKLYKRYLLCFTKEESTCKNIERTIIKRQ